MGVGLAEFALVLLGMVELFHSIVSFEALLPIGDALVVSGTGGNLRAHLAGVAAEGPPPVLLVIMIVKTPLRVMLRLCVMLHQKWTGLSFEFGQVQKYQNVLRVLVAPIHV
jgi:hypothetical protein